MSAHALIVWHVVVGSALSSAHQLQHDSESAPPPMVGSISRDGPQFFTFKVAGRVVTVEQQEAPRRRGSSEDLHSVVWESAQLLHAYLTDERRYAPGHFAGKRVIELGSGTGAVGLMLAALGALVTLTDVPAALPRLQRNLEANFPSGASAASHRVLALEWGEPLPEVLGADFDLVVCSDLLYNNPHAQRLLLRTILQLAGAGTEVLIGQVSRGPHSFYRRLEEAGFATEAVSGVAFAPEAILSDAFAPDEREVVHARRRLAEGLPKHTHDDL